MMRAASMEAPMRAANAQAAPAGRHLSGPTLFLTA